MTLDDILSRLDKVRRIGDRRATARCPAHQDSKPSLSLTSLDDGTVLLNCFGGCHPLDVCQAIGIEFPDLFPNSSRVRRVDATERRTGLSATDRLALLEHEAAVVLFIASDFMHTHTMSDENVKRLAAAVHRIGIATLG